MGSDDILDEAVRVSATNPTQALRITEQVLASEPENPIALTAHAYALASNGHDAEAQQAAHHAIQLDPGNSILWLGLASVYDMAGRHDEAVDTARRAVTLDPNDADPYVAVAASLISRLKEDRESRYDTEHDLEVADAHAARASHLDPRHSEAFALRAEVAAMRQQDDAALELSRQALQLDPNCSRAHVAALSAHVAKRQSREAAEHLRQIHQLPNCRDMANSFALSTSPRPGAAMVAFFVVLVALAEFGGGWWWALMYVGVPIGVIGGGHLAGRRKFMFGPIRTMRRRARSLS